MPAGDLRTHYDVLGVGTTASADEIRAAHRQLARVLHPDRQIGATPAERALADRRMREVNSAWAQLSNPQRRAAYDRTLSGTASSGSSGSSASSGSSGSGSNGSNGAGDRPTVGADDEWDPAPVLAGDEADLGPVAYHLLRRGPIVAALVVAAFLFVLTAYAGTSTDIGDPVPTSVDAGSQECVRLVDIDSRTAVRAPCDDAADGRLITAVAQPLDCPAGTRYVIVEHQLMCVTSDPSITSSNVPGD